MTKTKRISKVKSAWASIMAQVRRVVVRTPGNPHHAFRLTRPKRYRVSQAEFKAAWRLLADSWIFIWRNKRILLSLGLLYTLLAYVLVGGISQMDYVSFKDAAQDVIHGDFGRVGTAFTLFGAAVTGGLNSAPTDVQQFISAVLILFFWLAIVWASRMLSAGKEITLRDALYNSGAPILPSVAVTSVILVQLLPATIGLFAWATAQNGGWLADGGVEAMLFAVAAALLGLLSAYWVVSSLTALVIVALPGTYPWQALQEARALVMNRRWGLVLRVLVALVAILLVWVVVLVPIFLLDGWLRFDWLPLVPVFTQILIGLTLVYSSVYIYKLYRSLL